MPFKESPVDDGLEQLMADIENDFRKTFPNLKPKYGSTAFMFLQKELRAFVFRAIEKAYKAGGNSFKEDLLTKMKSV